MGARTGGVTHRWLHLDLAAPLMAFGGTTIDAVGVVRDFPAASMLAGLIGNALGLHWRDGAALQDIQDRLVFGAAIRDSGIRLTDMQNAQLSGGDRGWTTRGAPEGREGGSYGAPHRRSRDYHAGAELSVVLRLIEGLPDTGTVAAAFERPARPLFLGRKPCLPSRPLVAGWIEAETVHHALAAAGAAGKRAIWPADEGPSGHRTHPLPDLRNWAGSGLHNGTRVVVEGVV